MQDFYWDAMEGQQHHGGFVCFLQDVVHQSMAFLPEGDADAYFHVVAVAPHVVQYETPHELFYNFFSENYYTAASSLAKYWRLRRALFQDDYTLPLPLALKPQDWNHLLLGTTVQLPPREDGCSLLFVDMENLLSVVAAADDSLLPVRRRCLFYMFHMMQFQSTSNGRFSVLLLQAARDEQGAGTPEQQELQSGGRGGEDDELQQLTQTLLHQCMCLQPLPEQIHLITMAGPDAPVTLLPSWFPATWRHGRVLKHCCDSLLRKSLERAGFVPQQLPAQLGGSMSDDEWPSGLCRQFNAPYASRPFYLPATGGATESSASGQAMTCSFTDSEAMLDFSSRRRNEEGGGANVAKCTLQSPEQQPARPLAAATTEEAFIATLAGYDDDDSIKEAMAIAEAEIFLPPTPNKSLAVAAKETQQHGAERFPSFAGHPVHEAMALVTDTNAYQEAVQRSPHVVGRETPHDRYLKFFEHNVWEAAQRLANYWKWRVEIFGEDKAFLGLRQGALQPEDYNFLLSGKDVLMPPDSSGRSVLFIDRSIVHAPPKPHELPCRARSIFFLFHTLMEEQWRLANDGHNEGHVGEYLILVKTHKSKMAAFRSDNKHAELFRRLTYEAMCLTKCSHLHLVSSFDQHSACRRVLEALLGKVFLSVSSWFGKMPTTLHDGTASEINASLAKHGFLSSGLPKSFGGSWSVNGEWAQFLQQKVASTPNKSDGIVLTLEQPTARTAGIAVEAWPGPVPDHLTEDTFAPSEWTDCSDTFYEKHGGIDCSQCFAEESKKGSVYTSSLPSFLVYDTQPQPEGWPRSAETPIEVPPYPMSQSSLIVDLRPCFQATPAQPQQQQQVKPIPTAERANKIDDTTAVPPLQLDGATQENKLDSLIAKWASYGDKDIVQSVDRILEARKAKRRTQYNDWFRRNRAKTKMPARKRRSRAIKTDRAATKGPRTAS